MSWRRPAAERVTSDVIRDVMTGEDVSVRLPVDPSNRAVVTFIIQTTASELNIPIHSILGDRRDKKNVQARHIAIFLVYSWTRMSLQDIGKIFNRDHSTVNHVMEKMSAHMAWIDAPGEYVAPLLSVEGKLIDRYSERKPK